MSNQSEEPIVTAVSTRANIHLENVNTIYKKSESSCNTCIRQNIDPPTLLATSNRNIEIRLQEALNV